MSCYFGLDSEKDCRGTPCASCTANEPEDLVTFCKMAVISAACGIKSLDDAELLDRLEKLFLQGVKEGIKAKNEEYVPEYTDIEEFQDLA